MTEFSPKTESGERVDNLSELRRDADLYFGKFSDQKEVKVAADGFTVHELDARLITEKVFGLFTRQVPFDKVRPMGIFHGVVNNNSVTIVAGNTKENCELTFGRERQEEKLQGFLENADELQYYRQIRGLKGGASEILRGVRRRLLSYVARTLDLEASKRVYAKVIGELDRDSEEALLFVNEVTDFCKRRDAQGELYNRWRNALQDEIDLQETQL